MRFSAYEMRIFVVAVCVIVAISSSSCSVENNDRYREYFPKSDGDKPEDFKFGYSQTCVIASPGDRDAYLASVHEFALSRHMLRISPKTDGQEIIASYSRGAPMRVHLVVKRTEDEKIFMGISTLRGLECEDCSVAESVNIPCPS